MKSLLVLISILSYITIQAQNATPDSISTGKLSAFDSLKQEHEKAIQFINDQETKAIFPHDSICRNIEMLLKEDSEKKIGRLSIKKRSDLQKKLLKEKAIINMKCRIYDISRKEKNEEFEEKLNYLKHKTDTE